MTGGCACFYMWCVERLLKETWAHVHPFRSPFQGLHRFVGYLYTRAFPFAGVKRPFRALNCGCITKQCNLILREVRNSEIVNICLLGRFSFIAGVLCQWLLMLILPHIVCSVKPLVAERTQQGFFKSGICISKYSHPPIILNPCFLLVFVMWRKDTGFKIRSSIFNMWDWYDLPSPKPNY